MRPTDDLRTWAAAYREAGQPSDVLRQRILAAVQAVEDEPVETTRQPGSWRTWAVGLGVGALLGAAALLLLSWVVRFVRPEAEHALAVPSTAPYARPSEEHVQEAESRVPAPKVVDRAPATPEAPPIDPPPASSPAPRKSGVVQAQPSAPEPQAEPRVLAPSEDLESLRRLRAAEQLLASDPARARALLEAHARAYPRTSVDVEREALWIRAVCRSGGAESLERRRAAFAQRTGVSAYLAAIARDCDRR